MDPNEYFHIPWKILKWFKRGVNENGQWSEGPKLKFKRRNHAVGIVTDKITLEKIVVVTGGDGEEGELKSTEKLLENSNWWSLGEISFNKKLSKIHR